MPKRKGVRVAGWNAKNASGKRLRRYVKGCVRRGCMAIVLTEVWTRHDELGKIADEFNLRLIAERPGPRNGVALVSEHGDTVMLLCSGFDVERVQWIELTRKWLVFSAKKWHQPRRFPRVVGTYQGQRYELLALHGPTGGNDEAVAEFKSKVDGILTRTRDDTIAAGIGDMNFRLDVARPWAGARRMYASGHGPDLILANRPTSSRRRGKRGSDHYAMEHLIKERR